MPKTVEWLYWDCVECGLKHICGDDKQCPACGHQITHEERMRMEGTVDDVSRSEDVITDTATIARVDGSEKADWWCNVCDKSVVFDRKTCELCGCPRNATFEDIERIRTARGVKEAREMKGEERTLLVERHGPMEGRELLAGRGTMEKSGWQDAAAMLTGSPSGERTATPVIRRFPTRTHLIAGACTLVLLGLVWLLVWGFRTHEVVGRVEALTWERSEVVDRYTPVTRSDWRSSIIERPPQMPIKGSGESPGAVIVSCMDKWHHNDQVACGSYEERYTVTIQDPDVCKNVSVSKTRRVADGQDCHTTSRSCTSNKNGTKTCTGGDRVCTTRYRNESYQDTERRCESRSHQESRTRTKTKYCPVPVSYPYCHYTTYEWQQVRADRRAGSGHDTAWPGLSAGSLERMKQYEVYKIHLTWNDDDSTGSDSKSVSESEYRTWNADSQVIVDVRNFGGAASWRRK